MGTTKELFNDVFVGIGSLAGWWKRSSVVSLATSPDGAVVSSGKLHSLADDGFKRNVSNAFLLSFGHGFLHTIQSPALVVDWRSIGEEGNSVL